MLSNICNNADVAFGNLEGTLLDGGDLLIISCI
jgi:hypothetical protein